MTKKYTWQCMCGNFQGEVMGDSKLAVFCHCKTCRQYAGTSMQLGIWDPTNFKAIMKGGDETKDLISYEATPGVQRKSCKTCGSYAYKKTEGAIIAPLGCLEGGTVKPTAHIFMKDKGDQDVPFPELKQYDGFPDDA